MTLPCVVALVWAHSYRAPYWLSLGNSDWGTIGMVVTRGSALLCCNPGVHHGGRPVSTERFYQFRIGRRRVFLDPADLPDFWQEPIFQFGGAPGHYPTLRWQRTHWNVAGFAYQTAGFTSEDFRRTQGYWPPGLKWPSGPPAAADSRLLLVPCWVIFLATALAPTVMLHASLRRRHRLKAGLCLRCGYDLRASAGRCPECGALGRLCNDGRRIVAVPAGPAPKMNRETP